MEAQLRRLGPNSRIKILKTPKDCRTRVWLAGRGTTCQIYTKSKYASRQHFSITYREQKYFISDLQSANGTFLNDEKLLGEKVLSFGNVIGVGVPIEMQNSPDCIVYVFESYSDVLPANNQLLVPEDQTLSEKQKNTEPKLSSNFEIAPILESEPNQKTDGSICPTAEEENEVEKIELNDSDVVLIEPPGERERHRLEPESESVPVKRIKLEGTSFESVKEFESVELDAEKEGKSKEGDVDEDDIFAYEAMTQIDEPEIKAEHELLNYSQTEELIEISDSEDDWSPCLKQEGGNKSPEGVEDDDDVVFLERIIKEPRKTDSYPIRCKVEDDLTETDKRWMGKLLKMEVENSTVDAEMAETGEEQPEAEEMDETGEESSKTNETNVLPCAETLSRLSMQDVQNQNRETTSQTFPRVEIPRTIVKKVVPKKYVSFNMVPEIRYFEVPTRKKLSASEVGRIRFTRVIYNICNWNSHWLEECKKVAPDKHPPGICEERLRKIPRKFPCHSDYMIAFIPAMLLHLWNKIKDKWVTSGDSGFRQTLSCDSCDDYHAENLSVYKCTGLVQNVDAHKQLIREGHLVLLRLHQIHSPEFTTPASEKYSKKLGYLVFGFVEKKTYERFHKHSLHPSLAERCASVVGDLHVVRLEILVKKRPSFQIDKQKLIQLTVVHHISQEIRLFKAICLLPDSPLCSAILKPCNIEPLLVEPPETDLVFKGPLDEAQGKIVRKLSHACSTTNTLLYNIFGAAGTGKSQLAVALIFQLLYGDEWKRKRPKIIYCTQWSIPLDETVVKLKNCRQSMGEPFSLVRVGPVREVKPEVRDLCVSNLASSLRLSNKRGFDGRNFDAEIEVIKDTDVICTTCMSTGISKMCAAFEKLLMKDRDQKVICIVDNAMSSREAESVIPLLLGVTHLILVGDMYQMEPTFSGEKTNELGLDMPLFWRIYKNFLLTPKERWPIFILKTQYRMYSNLSKFTSQLIYNTQLQKPSVSATMRIRNLKSHILFVYQTPDNVRKEEKETRETRIVSQLTKAVTRLAKSAVKNIRIALITCDTRQTELLRVALPKSEFPDLEIEKIQSFQGREFELVVFAYDGRKVLNSWLVTAITRARSSLYIFASEQSIKGNTLLQKISKEAEQHGFLKYTHPDTTVKEYEDVVWGV